MNLSENRSVKPYYSDGQIDIFDGIHKVPRRLYTNVNNVNNVSGNLTLNSMMRPLVEILW